MGTALVKYFESWEQFETWLRNMRRQSANLTSRVQNLLIIGLIAAAALLFMIGINIGSGLAIILALTGGLGLAYELFVAPRGRARNSLADFPYLEVRCPCPHCHHPVNLSEAWVCGWCAESYDTWLPGDHLRTPVQGCSNRDCEATQLHRLSRPTGDQTALQCPNCSRHIILDPLLYNERQSYVSPFRGVARLLGDTRPPNDPQSTHVLMTPEARLRQTASSRDDPPPKYFHD